LVAHNSTEVALNRLKTVLVSVAVIGQVSAVQRVIKKNPLDQGGWSNGLEGWTGIRSKIFDDLLDRLESFPRLG
jgi:hypothetical protein